GALGAVPAQLGEAAALLRRTAALAAETLTAVEHQTSGEVRWWAGELLRLCQAHEADLVRLAPWTAMDLAPLRAGAAEPLMKFLDGLECNLTVRQVAALPELLEQSDGAARIGALRAAVLGAAGH